MVLTSEWDSADETTTQAHPDRHPWTAEDPAPDAPPPATGAVLGRYIVIDRLGSGGSGSVFRAYDPQLDRRVAVKVLHSEGIASTRRREFLLREGQAMARLSHPNVVPVYDVGPHGDDLFVAMELVEGQSLSEWLRVPDRPWKEIRRVFLQAGAGLSAAHRAGLVHRDFKPGNVLVELDPSGRVRRVLVADFGLARSANASSDGLERISPSTPSSDGHLLASPLTEHGLVKGTPGYMPPEHLEGRLVTPATDQFSFCVSLWRALYREWPYDAAPARGSGRDRPLRQPTDRAGVPAWFHAVLERGLSLDAARRFPDMDALLHAMRRDLRSRRRLWMGIAVAGVLSVSGAVAGAVLLRPPPSAAALGEVDTLALEARAVAARAYFVYPDPDDPQGHSAYTKVLALEGLQGAGERGALAVAAELREEFSETLVRLGDEYFAREGGRPFAADYYAAALVFSPQHEHARARTSLTPGEVADLRERSASGAWSPAELAAGESLAALATDDPQERTKRLRRLRKRGGPVAVSTAARMRPLLSAEEQAALEGASPEATPAAARPDAQPETEPPDEVVPDEVVPELEPEGAADPSTSDAKPHGSLTEAGLAALREHRFDDAQRLLGRAVAKDRRDARALAGLAEVHFERGSYRKAVSFGERAVRRAPKTARYRILLGDAYFKTLAFNAARRQYESARELGHPKASDRLRQLGTEMGN